MFGLNQMNTEPLLFKQSKTERESLKWKIYQQILLEKDETSMP